MSSIYNIIAPEVAPNTTALTASHLEENANSNLNELSAKNGGNIILHSNLQVAGLTPSAGENFVGTASFANNIPNKIHYITASQANNSFNAITASYLNYNSSNTNTGTASYAINATTASYTKGASSSSYAQTASYALTSSYASGSNVFANSSSYAQTSSYISGFPMVRAAVSFNGVNATITSSYNINSVVRISEGTYTIKFNNVINTSSAWWSGNVTSLTSPNGNAPSIVINSTSSPIDTGSMQIRTLSNSAAATDYAYVTVLVYSL
jgi:hypothetical protein